MDRQDGERRIKIDKEMGTTDMYDRLEVET